MNDELNKITYLLYEGQGEVTKLHHMGTDATPAHSARVSFNKDEVSDTDELSPRDTKLIKYLADHQHLSPFEHLTATLRITCPLYIARQVMRHRTFSYNETSRRYTAEDVRLHRITDLRAQSARSLQCSESTAPHYMSDELLKEMRALEASSLALYRRLVEEGVAREQARSVLPQSMMTSFWMTGNLRNWAHFLKLRLDAHAQPEAQELARGVKSVLAEIWPTSLAALLGELEEETR